MQQEESIADRLRSLPAVGRLIQFFPDKMRARAAEAARQVVAGARLQILSGGMAPTESDLVHQTRLALESIGQLKLRPAINATGVVLNTGLGRAVLAREAVENLVHAAAGHSTLEVDVETGRRGSRLTGVVGLLRRLVGCEDAVVVNNNAAAVLLAIRVLALGREVIISRGQLVEIGGQFRIPDVIASAGARLVEVGTTNKTHFSDYQRAISPETGLLLHVHPSNFRILGFTSEAPLEKIAALGKETGLISLADLGSGALLDLSGYGVPGEPTVQQVHATGVDICTWSGDKLLGGPQCGIITGRRDLVTRMKQDPLMRALRVDKLTLAALEATLRLYLQPDEAREAIPTLRAITRPLDSIWAAGQRLLGRLQENEDHRAEVCLVETQSQVGGGSLPGEEIRSCALSLKATGISLDVLAKRLRMGTPAVFGRTSQGRFLLDLRTVAPEEEEELFQAIVRGLSGGENDCDNGR